MFRWHSVDRCRAGAAWEVYDMIAAGPQMLWSFRPAVDQAMTQYVQESKCSIMGKYGCAGARSR